MVSFDNKHVCNILILENFSFVNKKRRNTMKAEKPTAPKSWKKINQEKKEFKKKKQKEKLIKQLEQAKKLEELNQEKVEEEKILPVSTISIAVPGSILENAQSAELRSYLAGQIARAACIFKIDEVIVFDDHTEISRPKAQKVGQDEGEIHIIYTFYIQLRNILFQMVKKQEQAAFN